MKNINNLAVLLILMYYLSYIMAEMSEDEISNCINNTTPKDLDKVLSKSDYWETGFLYISKGIFWGNCYSYRVFDNYSDVKKLSSIIYSPVKHSCMIQNTRWSPYKQNIYKMINDKNFIETECPCETSKNIKNESFSEIPRYFIVLETDYKNWFIIQTCPTKTNSTKKVMLLLDGKLSVEEQYYTINQEYTNVQKQYNFNPIFKIDMTKCAEKYMCRNFSYSSMKLYNIKIITIIYFTVMYIT